MPWPEPVTLSGRHAELAPLARDDLDGLIDAARDGQLWNLWYTSVPAPDKMLDNIEFRLDWQSRGGMLPFVVRRQSDRRIVGATSYCNIAAAHKRVEIGYTWYARSAQRTPLNTECKRMLLAHAFEVMGCAGVEFRTHWHNLQSRAAIERLGAKLDGVLRSHQIMPDGSLRDTCVYSIIAHEWPAVKNHLDFQLARERQGG
jgi:RimJ/RimL family protein N-acetyltransferase